MTRDDRELLRLIHFLESTLDAPSFAEMSEATIDIDIATSLRVLRREGMIETAPVDET